MQKQQVLDRCAAKGTDWILWHFYSIAFILYIFVAQMQRTLFTRGFNIATSRNTQIPTHKLTHTHTRTVTETEHVTITTTTKKLLSAKHTHTPSLWLSILFSRSLAHHVRCCFWLGKRNKIFFF